MIVLTWDWTTCLGIVIVGLLTGALAWPYLWPDRMANRIRPPEAIVLTTALMTIANFVIFLALLRALRTEHVELQASVLLVTYIVACWVGLGIRSESWR